ncbi:MAG: cyclic nucleotide-binding domain-containing protein, partial [Pseudomonadota bacterium]
MSPIVEETVSRPQASGNPERRTIATGEVLFKEGEPSDRIALILEGALRVIKQVDDEAIELGRITAGQFVGEMGVIEQRPRNATVTAESPTTVEFLSLEHFLAKISGNRDLAFQTLLRLCERLHRADDRLVALAQSARQNETQLENRALQIVPQGPSRNQRGGSVAIQIFAGSDRTAIDIP